MSVKSLNQQCLCKLVEQSHPTTFKYTSYSRKDLSTHPHCCPPSCFAKLWIHNLKCFYGDQCSDIAGEIPAFEVNTTYGCVSCAGCSTSYPYCRFCALAGSRRWCLSVCTHVGDLDEALGSWLLPGPALWSLGEWTNRWNICSLPLPP